MSVIKEFREFVMKGNIMDLAIAVIIGAAFGAIISSLVDDVITTGSTLISCAESILTVPGASVYIAAIACA